MTNVASCLAVFGLVASCAAHGQRANTAREPDLKRGFADLRHAIDDLSHLGGSWDVGPAIRELEETLTQLCKEHRASCAGASEVAWSTRGESGQDLAHALGDLDRAYSFLVRRTEHEYGSKFGNIEHARHEVRELLLRRDRLAISTHLPATRMVLLFLKDLEYVRSLVDGIPPAEMPWDFEAEIARLDALLTRIRIGNFDPDAARITTRYTPDLADFAALSYRERLEVASDVLSRSAEELATDSIFTQLSSHEDQEFSTTLRDAVSELASVPSGVLTVPDPRRRYRARDHQADPYDLQLIQLTQIARDMVGGDMLGRVAVEDAFKAALVAEHLQMDKSRWNPDLNDAGVVSIDLVIAVFEAAPGNRFAESLRHLEIARRAMYHNVALNEAPEAQTYLQMLNELELVRALVNTATTSDTPWDPRSAVARLDSAIAAIRRTFPTTKNTYFASPSTFSNVPYRQRLWVSRDVLKRAVAEFEREASPGTAKGPRKTVVPLVRAVIDAVDGAIKRRESTAAAR